jgi:D-sedoheptulose 7-phosphate isomerase
MSQPELYPYQEYAAHVGLTLDSLPWAAIDRMVQILHRARMVERQVFIVGNGGSASTATHMACDLGKNTQAVGVPRFRVLSLNDNMASFSAWANDSGYENVFAEQLANFARPADVLVAISTSGNSPNVLKAVDFALDHCIYTIGWTGYEGGKLAERVDLPIVVPNHEIELVEDIHLVLQHMVTRRLRNLAQQASVHLGAAGAEALPEEERYPDEPLAAAELLVTTEQGPY